MMVMISVVELALTVSPSLMPTETTVPLMGLVEGGLGQRLLGVGEVGLGAVDVGLIGRDLFGGVGVGRRRRRDGPTGRCCCRRATAATARVAVPP